MALATGAQTQFIYLDEDIEGAGAWGTTPVGTFSLLPYTSVSLVPKKESFASEIIRNDRQTQNIRHGFESIEFALESEFVSDDFDFLLQAALFGTTTGVGPFVTKAGTDRFAFSAEIGFNDIVQYMVATGIMINSMTVSVSAADPIAKVSFSGLGKGWGAGFSGTTTEASPTAAAGGAPMGSADAVIKEGANVAGLASLAVITAMEFTIENNLEAARVIQATPEAAALQEGRSKVTGKVDAYFEDATLINKFLAETEAAISLDLTDGTDTYSFVMPKIKYSGGDNPVDGEGGLLIGLPFEAYWDATEATSLRITKSP